MPEKQPKQKIPVNKPLPRGEEGLAAVLELHNKLLLESYPAVQDDFHRLITRVDQIRWASRLEIDNRKSRRLADNITYRLFRAAGVLPSSLNKHFIDSEEALIYDLEEAGPVVYLPRNVLNNLEDLNPLKRLTVATNTVGGILEVNFKLLPHPIEIPRGEGGIINSMLGAFKMDLDKIITDVGVNSSDRLGEDDLQIIKEIVHRLIHTHDSKYQPRVVSNGGCLLLVLPHQNRMSAESMVQIQEHKNAYYYLAIPVIAKLLSLVAKEWQTRGGNVGTSITKKVDELSKRGEEMFESLDATDVNNAFNLYVSSDLGRRIIEQRNNLHGAN